MMRPLRDWDRFFFEPQTAKVLGIYRIAIGLLTLYSFLLFAKDATAFFSDRGLVTVATLDRVVGRDWHSILAWIRNPLGVKGVLAGLFIAGVLFTIGFHTRASSILLFVLVTSFHERNGLVLNSGDAVLRTMLFFFMFAPAGAAFSVDGLLKSLRKPPGEPDPPARVLPWAQRMMQLQVAIIYLTTACQKSRGDLYRNGSAMYYVFGLVDFNVHGVENLMNYPGLTSTLTYGMLAIEFTLPCLLWFKASRPYGMALGVLLHLWIMWCMTMPVFGILMISTYLCFLREEELDGAIAWVRGRLSKSRARVYIDGDCGLCLRARGLLERLDLWGRLEFLNARESRSGADASLDETALLETIHLVTPRGTILTGFKAYRWMALRMPASGWLAPLLYLPGIPRLGEIVYRRIASHRTRSCRIPSIRMP